MVRVRRLATLASRWIAVFAAAALLLVPVTATAGADMAHPHALLQLLVDGADGSFDHHDDPHPVGPGHSHGHDHGAAAPDPSGAVAVAVHDSSPHPSTAAALGGAARGRSAANRADDALAAVPDDVPTLSPRSAAVVAGALPLADLAACLLQRPSSAVLLAWSPTRIPTGVDARPFAPPPRVAAAA